MKIEAELIQSGDNGDNLITSVVIVDGVLMEKEYFTHNANSYREGPYASPDDAGYSPETLADILADDAVIDGDIFVDEVQTELTSAHATAIYSVL